MEMEWKIFGTEWKWNGRKLTVWNMEKLSSIPFHTMPCPFELKKQHNFVDIKQFVTLCKVYFLLNDHLSCCYSLKM